MIVGIDYPEILGLVDYDAKTASNPSYMKNFLVGWALSVSQLKTCWDKFYEAQLFFSRSI
jgi:hypothetical protein